LLLKEYRVGSPVVDVAILGAGPYGLSIAAHLGKMGVPYRIFGPPMQSWQSMMPKGMLLKSDGFASSLSSPDNSFSLEQYCKETGQPYAHVGIPVPIETFIAYGLEFQRRLVPNLEQVYITSVKQHPAGFALETEQGETVLARKVVVAAGITHFAYLPPLLANLPKDLVTHTSHHSNLTRFKCKKVAVLGAGSSAVDVAALLREAEADVEIVARANSISFHEPPVINRPFLQRIKNPRSGLGLGWRSRLCTDIPLVFHAMPRKFRFRVVKRHLGPAPGWFVKEKIVGRVPMHMGVNLEHAEARDGQIHLKVSAKDGSTKELVFDHLIAGTGYRVALTRLKFLSDGLRAKIHAVEDSPVLNRSFQSSIPGLYFVGVASANSFGPLTRFAFGSEYTANRLSRHLAKSTVSDTVLEPLVAASV
jgi:thioredoxin reductase